MQEVKARTGSRRVAHTSDLGGKVGNWDVHRSVVYHREARGLVPALQGMCSSPAVNPGAALWRLGIGRWPPACLE